MSENIRVSEVSEILRQQLEGIETKVQLDEIGTVLQVSDGVVRIYGLRNAEANELLEFDNGIKAIVMNLEEDNVGAVLLGPTDKIKEGFTVKRTKRIASIRVGESMLGRVIDPLGEPLDGKGLIGGELYEMPLERKAPDAPYFFGFCSSKTLNLFSVVQNICIRHAHARNSRLQILQLCISVIPDQDAQADEDDSAGSGSLG